MSARDPASVVVEPPHEASYVRAAYVPGTVDANSVAWSVPVAAVEKGEHLTLAQQEIQRMIRISGSKGFRDGGAVEDPRFLGVIYADSPLAKDATFRHELSSVSVVVSGLVTIVHEAFDAKEKTNCTAGKFVHAHPNGLLKVSADRTLADGSGYQRVGMLMEVGSNMDGRVLLC